MRQVSMLRTFDISALKSAHTYLMSYPPLLAYQESNYRGMSVFATPVWVSGTLFQYVDVPGLCQEVLATSPVIILLHFFQGGKGLAYHGAGEHA